MGGTREERERLAESRPRVPVLIWGTAVAQDARPHKLQATVFSAHSEFLEMIFLKISLNVHPFPRRKLSPLPGASLGQARETSLRRRPPGSRRRALRAVLPRCRARPSSPRSRHPPASHGLQATPARPSPRSPRFQSRQPRLLLCPSRSFCHVSGLAPSPLARGSKAGLRAARRHP